MYNNYIKIFDNEYNQNQFLENINEINNPHILTINRDNNKLAFSNQGTYNKTIKYDNENYLDLDIHYINNDFFIIPNDVNNLEISINGSTEIKPIKNLFNKNYKQPIYKIGLMSDVHYNDADDADNNPDTYADDGAEYSEDLINALQYFQNNNVDFISCSGDISTDWSAHLSNYKLCVDKYASNLSIFTCSGNHDSKPKYKYHDLWKNVSVINPNNEYEIIYFKDYEQYSQKIENFDEYDLYHTDDNGLGTSFYFKKYYDDTFDVYIYLNVEYGWNNRDNYDTHNCRILTQQELLVHQEVTDDDLHLYHPQTLQYLANLLEEYKHHRCFIFTHLMLPDKAGNFHHNQVSQLYYYEYCNIYSHSDILRGDQGEFIRNLMEQYDNNYWFSGHSHYKWIWEKLDHNINITKINKSYNIHLPSLSRPLPYGILSYKTAPKDSEAAIMEVYKDYVIIKGIVMKEYIDINYYNLDTYPDENMEYVTANMFTLGGNNESTIEQLEDNYIQINFIYNQNGSNADNDIFLNNGTINASNFGNNIPVLRFEDVQIWFDEMYDYFGYDSNNISDNDRNMLINEITDQIKYECKIGFRDNTTNTNQWLYYFISNHIYTLYENGIDFKVSSSSQFKQYHLHIKLKMKLGFKHIGYTNQYLPIACYKLKSHKKEED